jgi:hypothetical protein
LSLPGFAADLEAAPADLAGGLESSKLIAHATDEEFDVATRTAGEEVEFLAVLEEFKEVAENTHTGAFVEFAHAEEVERLLTAQTVDGGGMEFGHVPLRAKVRAPA